MKKLPSKNPMAKTSDRLSVNRRSPYTEVTHGKVTPQAVDIEEAVFRSNDA